MASLAFNAPNDTAAFAGVWSDAAFDRVEIRETTGAIENEFFGQFYTGTTPIPEPATLTLFGTGLALIGLALRRRRKAA